MFTGDHDDESNLDGMERIRELGVQEVQPRISEQEVVVGDQSRVFNL